MIRAAAKPSNAQTPSPTISSSSTPAAIPPTKVTVSGTPVVAPVVDRFTPLESALIEASKAALSSAKQLEATDKRKAVDQFKEYKKHHQELTVLQSRREVPGARPALFNWRTNQREEVLEHLDLSDDRMEVLIVSLDKIDSLLSSQSSRSVSVSVEGIGSSASTETIYQSPALNYSAEKVVMNFKSQLEISRSRSAVAAFKTKKLRMKVMLHKGFFSGSDTLATVIFPLVELLHKCEVSADLPLLKEGTRREIGGTLRIQIRLRRPMEGPHKILVEERVLVVDPWPEVPAEESHTVEASPPPEEVKAVNIGAVEAAVSQDKPLAGPSHGTGSPAADSQITDHKAVTQADLSAKFASLTADEKEEPLDPLFLYSNDVLEMELALAKSKANTKGMSPDEVYQLSMRAQLIQTKLESLVMQVQSERLSLESYLQNVAARLAQDKLLAVYLSSADRKQEALAVLRRVKVMEKELADASSNSEATEVEVG